MNMTEAAREARRKYQREWNARNVDKRREYMARYWARKANEADSMRKKSEETGRKQGNT